MTKELTVTNGDVQDADAISLWEGPDDRRTRIDKFRTVQKQSNTVVSVSLRTWRSTDLPDDVEGCPITVTEDGEHTNTSVVDHTRTAPAHELPLAPTGPRIITP